MFFRFRRRIRVGKNTFVNVGKHGIASISRRRGRLTTSIGKRGLHESLRLGNGASVGCLWLFVAIPAGMLCLFLR
jgi:hypothetical protein